MSDAGARAADMWSLGDYAVIARRLEPGAEALVQAAGVSAGDRVLDVAAGNGNVAIAAAARGAHVVASDISPHMVELGRARPNAADVEWIEADAQELPFGEASFDRTLSAFGVVFAPDPVRAASEMVRVTRREGVLGLTAWTTDGVNAAAGEVIRSYLPPVSGPSPEDWGAEGEAERRLKAAGADEVRVERHTFHWRFESLDAWVEFMTEGAPPIVAARRAIGEERWPEALGQLREAIRSQGRETESAFTVDPEYLVVTARRLSD